MYGVRAALFGPFTAGAGREHAECGCVTVLVESEDGVKLMLDLDDRAALEALGWALLQAADGLPADADDAAPAAQKAG